MSTFHPLRTKVQTFRNGREISSRGVLENQKIRPARVIGPLGTLLAIEDLPPVEARWSPRRKAEVVSAVDGGLLSMAEACDRYSISIEELVSWCRALERVGLRGLRVTRTQHYRQQFERFRP